MRLLTVSRATMHTPLTDAIEGSQPARGPLAARIVLGLLKGYKILISPLFTGACRFQPSCADYMAEAVKLHGVRRGVWLGMRQVVSLQAVRGARVRSRPAHVDPLHGTQGFRRHFVVVRGAVRVSGALCPAAETRSQCRRAEGTSGSDCAASHAAGRRATTR